MAYFRYPCPDCRTTSTLHAPECRFDGTSRADVEKAYTDVLACLVVAPRTADELRSAVHGRWDALREGALGVLRREQRVRETDGGVLELLTPAAHRELVSEPTQEPMRTIYRKGSVPGCHDNAVFAMIAWYEMVGFSWEETRERVVEWLRESGTWARGGFEEASPEALVDGKRHVYEQGYGWKEKAQAAKGVIDRTA